MEFVLFKILITLFVLFNIIRFILIKFFNYTNDNTLLHCGIFGASLKKGYQLNLDTVKILGLYNLTRGTDNCGYYYSGHLAKGVKSEANWANYIDSNELLRGDEKAEIFMGHTRKTTSGAEGEEEAHPHMVNEAYIQTHNGVIKNIWDITREYGVDYNYRDVDSLGLAKIIEKTRSFDVLEKYTGFAALAMHFTEQEGIYLFHGASRDKKDGTSWEERPLFYLKQPEGIYYSSMEESLNFINCDKKKFKTQILPHNVVHEVKNGVFTKFKQPIVREDTNLPKTVVHHMPDRSKQTSFEWDKKTHINNAYTEISSNTVIYEDYPLEKRENPNDNWRAYYMHGRHYRSKNILLHGIYRIDRDGKILKEGENSPNERLWETYYFCRGVMFLNAEKYNDYIKQFGKLDDEPFNFPMRMSSYSRYAVCALPNEQGTPPKGAEFKWYRFGIAADGTGFTPKFSSRMYTVTKGMLKSITPAKGDKNLYKTESAKQYVLDTGEDNEETEESLLVQEISDSCDAMITKEDLKVIPEAFFVFLDYFVRYFSNVNYTDDEVVQETDIIVKEMITTGTTLREMLAEVSQEKFLVEEHIKASLLGKDLNELMVDPNRYFYRDFDVNLEEEEEQEEEEAEIIEDKDEKFRIFEQNREAYKILDTVREQMNVLEDEIEKLMALEESEVAQDAAYVFRNIKEDGINFLKQAATKEFL